MHSPDAGQAQRIDADRAAYARTATGTEQAQREQRESLEADAGIVEMKKLFDAEIADDRPAGGTGRTA